MTSICLICKGTDVWVEVGISHLPMPKNPKFEIHNVERLMCRDCGEYAVSTYRLGQLCDLVATGAKAAIWDDSKKIWKAKELQPGVCTHSHWSFDKHGRICTCGTMIVDFGD